MARISNSAAISTFASEIINLIAAKDTTIAKVAAKSNTSRATLHATVNALSFPRREMVLRILRALDANAEQTQRILHLWEMARAGIAEPTFHSDVPLPQFGQPDPLTVATPAQLVEALRAVRIWAGSPSLRTLAARGQGRLSKSSVGAMLNSNELPKYERFVAYLFACGIRERNLDVWVFTWRRLKALQGPESQWMPGLTSAAALFG